MEHSITIPTEDNDDQPPMTREIILQGVDPARRDRARLVAIMRHSRERRRLADRTLLDISSRILERDFPEPTAIA